MVMVVEVPVPVTVGSQEQEFICVEQPQTVVVAVGQQGPAGASGSGVVPPFQFLTATQIWVVNHNLNRRPLIGVFSVGGIEMMAEVIHISANQVQVIFDNPVAGYAICS